MSSAEQREDRPTLAILLMAFAVLLFTLIDSSAKWLILYGLPATQVIFARYCGAFFILFFIFVPRGGFKQFSSNNPKLQACRALALLGGTTFNFLALKFLPITTTIAIFFAMPVVITVMSYLFLNENVGLRRFLAVLIGFLGVLTIIQPIGEEFHWAMILSICALLSASTYFILTRAIAGQDNNATSQLWSSGLATIIILPFVIQDWQWPDSRASLFIFALIGIFGATSHILATLAHRLANASSLAPTIYAQAIYAALIGYFIFNTIPSFWTVIGTIIIIMSGVYIWLRERSIKAISRSR